MPIEVASSGVICCKCGFSYGRRKGNFPVSYAMLHKGIGHVPYCKECIENMYNKYLSQCNNTKDAVRQMCRKLDLYWSESVYEIVSRKNTTHTMMISYIAKINTVTYAGKSYDDTLSEEGTLWNFSNIQNQQAEIISSQEDSVVTSTIDDDFEITDLIIERWGSGLTNSMYQELEKKRDYWISNLPKDMKVDVATEALIRQVCNLEVSINSDRLNGRQLGQNITTLNNLLGSLNLKPTQKKDDLDSSMANTPLGVWLYKFEHLRPLPEIDEDLKDVNKLRRYVTVWVRGHLAKMMGIKNSYSKAYEDEIARLRVEKPEYTAEDDEEFLADILEEETDNE